MEQNELARHKEIYEQLVKRYDNVEKLYKELEAQVRFLECHKGNSNQYTNYTT